MCSGVLKLHKALAHKMDKCKEEGAGEMISLTSDIKEFIAPTVSLVHGTHGNEEAGNIQHTWFVAESTDPTEEKRSMLKIQSALSRALKKSSTGGWNRPSKKKSSSKHHSCLVVHPNKEEIHLSIVPAIETGRWMKEIKAFKDRVYGTTKPMLLICMKLELIPQK